jgi:hypothetical protein
MKTLKLLTILRFSVLPAALLVSSVNAQVDFITIPAGTAPNGPALLPNVYTFLLGQEFYVGGSGIWVTSLGAYDDDDPNSFASASLPVEVGIFSCGGDNAGQLVTPIATFTDSSSGVASGDVLFQSITPVYLAPGGYVVTALGYSGLGMGCEVFGDAAYPPYDSATPWVFNDGGGILGLSGLTMMFLPISQAALIYPSGPGCYFSPSTQPEWAAGNFQFQLAVPPEITVQPVSQTANVGDTVNFSIAATGVYAPTYQWQFSANGGSSWADVPVSSPYSGEATDTLTITGATMSRNGYQYRCVATNGVNPDATSNAATLTVNKIVPVITWPTPAAITYGTALSAAQLDATASVPGSFVYSPAAGTVLGAGANTLHATFTPADTTDYTTRTATQIVTVSKAVPVITWPAPAAITYGTAVSSAQLNATASVPGTFVYSPAAGTVLKAGAQTLKAYFTPTDRTNFLGMTPTQTLTVNKAVSVITWAAPAGITYGTALSSAQLNATASVPGAFVYSPAAGTVLGAGANTLHATFTPTDSTDYTTATATQIVTVSKAVPVIIWPAPAAITYGMALSSAQLNATTGVPGTFVYSPAAGTVLKAGTQTLRAYFTPTDRTNFLCATPTQTLTVKKAVSVITWAAPAGINYGTALSAAQLNATASVPGAFVYSPAAGTVLGAGANTLHATFTPTDSTDYTTATATQIVTVSKAVPVITWPAPAAITYGTALSSAQLNATASVPGTFVYSPAAGTVLKAGTQTLRVTFTPTDRADFLCAVATQSLTVN